MFIDHIGATLLPEYEMMRHIGRIAFALFIFALVEGFFFTSSRPRYLLRLSVFALLSEIPFDLGLFGVAPYWEHQNVFLTLALGMAAMMGMEWVFLHVDAEIIQLLLQMLILLTAMAVAFLLRTDYKSYGVCTICVAYLLRRRNFGRLFEIIIIVAMLTMMNEGEIWSAFAIPFVALYDERKESHVSKWLFYLFYPLHLLGIYMVRLWL